VSDRSSSRPEPAVLRLAAFADDPTGGNPAGVVLDASGLADDAEAMMDIAAAVGDSETAFVVDGPVTTDRRAYSVRYFAPQAEVPFCGHATIALGVAIGQITGAGPLQLSTQAGTVHLEVTTDSRSWRATFASPAPGHSLMPDSDIGPLLDCFGWTHDVLDAATPPAVAWAGARHAVLALQHEHTLRAMSYEYDRLRALCLQHEWVTVHLAWAETPKLHHVRSPFPYGGVVEDPATGAGAAAYTAYLRDTARLPAPGELTIRQGVDMGRPSTLFVDFGATGPVRVGGPAVLIPDSR
jgi:PhzF family phenazine biosynthesis protein